MTNAAELQLVPLGTSSYASTTDHALPSLALLRGKDVFMFDAGGY